ncbi:hypothetical protein HG530_001972 [Fusarium avenaceum]|nr:hypothetical protein HG530_001972 [Fusarium avenaceum]
MLAGAAIGTLTFKLTRSHLILQEVVTGTRFEEDVCFVEQENGIPTGTAFQSYPKTALEDSGVIAEVGSIKTIERTLQVLRNCTLLAVNIIEDHGYDKPDSAVKVFPVPGGPHKSRMSPLPMNDVSLISQESMKKQTFSVYKVVKLSEVSALCSTHESKQEPLLPSVEDKFVKGFSIPLDVNQIIDFDVACSKGD